MAAATRAALSAQGGLAQRVRPEVGAPHRARAMGTPGRPDDRLRRNPLSLSDRVPDYAPLIRVTDPTRCARRSGFYLFEPDELERRRQHGVDAPKNVLHA